MANTLRNIGLGLARGITADVLGMPVDTLNMLREGLLSPAAGGNPSARVLGGLLGPVQQTGSGDWFAQQMGLPQGEGMAYEAARMVSPSPSDVMGLVRRAPIQEIMTYHGTPHRFEPTPENPLGEFMASKIGTGEGAQAYGHGIYLAEHEPTARYYAESVSSQHGQKLVDKAGNEISFPNPDAEGLAEVYLKGSSGYPEAKKQLLELAKDSEYADTYMQAVDALNKWESQGIKIGKQKEPAVYTSDLPDEMVDRMLDWDKPLSEQPQRIRDAFGVKIRDYDYEDALSEKAKKAGLSINDLPEANEYWKEIDASLNDANMTGEEIVRSLTKRAQGSKKLASDYLKALGIPGIKYLDAGSRGDKAKPTRNFVVFPGEEKKVKILKRE